MKNFNYYKYNNLCQTRKNIYSRRARLSTPNMTTKYCQIGIYDRRFVRLLLPGLILLATLARAADETASQTPQLTVGEIVFDSRDIFSENEIRNTNSGLSFMRRTMNELHSNTRQYVLRRELLFESGDVFNPDRLAETERNLRALGYLNNVSVTAVDTTSDGRVNIKIATRESWTLRTSFS